MVPRENKNNAYAKFGGTNKKYYGIFRSGLLWSLNNDNGDGNENISNLHIRWAKTIALHALLVRFSLLSISLRRLQNNNGVK